MCSENEDNKMLKKLNMFFVIVLLSMIVGKPTDAKAYEDTLVSKDVKEAVINSLKDIEPLKGTIFGDIELEFEELQIGSIIYGYEYVGNEFREIIQYFPLFHDDELVALASSQDGTHYQLETKIAEEICNRNVRNCAIIYASDGCYLYDGISFMLLTSYDFSNNRSNLCGRINYMGVMLCDLQQREELGYIQMSGARVQTYYSCNVPYVTQIPYNKICWAATIATISNYMNGTNYTAEQIARAHYGANFNEYVNSSTMTSIMRNTYNLNYTYHAYLIESIEIYGSIVSGYPVAGNCIYSEDDIVKASHSVTIYGINIISGYIVLMDPAGGSITVYGNPENTYEYSYWGSAFGVFWDVESGTYHS